MINNITCLFFADFFLGGGAVGFFTPSDAFYSQTLFGLYVVVLGDYIIFKKGKLIKLPLFLMLIASIALSLLSVTAVSLLSKISPVFDQHTTHFVRNDSPLITLAAVCVLLLCLRTKPFYSRIINLLSSTVLGVYLIHDNAWLSPHLWFDILKVQNHLEHIYLMLFVSVPSVFIACSLIVIARKISVERFFARVTDSFCTKVDGKLARIFNVDKP